MKAIETEYKGFRFRSRQEARWAVFFDSMGVPWEYEKEGYELKSGRYLPDFWLPTLDCYLESKGSVSLDFTLLFKLSRLSIPASWLWLNSAFKLSFSLG